MTAWRRIRCVGPQASDNANRITLEWQGGAYTVNQRTLNRYANGEELKAALEKFLGYSVPDIWFHKNRDGTWAAATGPNPPNPWPEDEPVIPEAAPWPS